jgi:hypothetical protein
MFMEYYALEGDLFIIDVSDPFFIPEFEAYCF